MGKEISVFRIDYEMRNAEEGEAKLWQASIAAYSQQEAIDYLGNFLGRTFKILTLGRECGLHAITDEIRKVIIDDYLAHAAKAQKELKPEKKPVGEKAPTKRGKSIVKK